MVTLWIPSGFYAKHVSKRETIEINLKNQIMILITKSRKLPLLEVYASEPDRGQKQLLIDPESEFLAIENQIVLIRSLKRTKLHFWVIPKKMCPNSLYSLSFNQLIEINFTIPKTLNSLCIFTPNVESYVTNTLISHNGKHGDMEVLIYNSSMKFNTHFQIYSTEYRADHPVFFSLLHKSENNISLTMKQYVEHIGIKRVPCSFKPIPIAINGTIINQDQTIDIHSLVGNGNGEIKIVITLCIVNCLFVVLLIYIWLTVCGYFKSKHADDRNNIRKKHKVKIIKSNNHPNDDEEMVPHTPSDLDDLGSPIFIEEI